MTKLLTRLALSAAIALLFLGLCAVVSCASAEKTKISRADETLTYGDTLGQDADEMIVLLEEG